MMGNRSGSVAPYHLVEPELRTSAVVFSSPHSGRHYPKDLLDRTHLSLTALRSSEDAFVDELFASAADAGAPLISAEIPRAYVDLNRSADDLDAALIAGITKGSKSPRISAGLGVVPRVVADSQVIMHGKITLSEASERIRRFHAPYHGRLRALLREARTMHGLAILIDCHSMPHDALIGSPLVNGVRPEIVLGDRFGASCDRWITDAAIDIFTSAGFRVARNAPFAGGYITQSYGQPSRGIHSLQIEIDRALYMDEARIAKRQRFNAFQQQFAEIVALLAGIGKDRSAIAAE